ncbi:putative xylanase 3 [Mariannaea sp. PMI_226]|nr:putative xylanase 3 [Mariannaea sp. PMI_226]
MFSSSVLSSCLPLLVIFSAQASASHDKSVDDANCDCYFINGSVPEYYTDQMFLDFRSLSQYAGVPDIITSRSKASNADVSSDYFKQKNWTDIWSIQDWDNRNDNGKGFSGDATYLMVNSASNLYIQKNEDDNADSDTYLTMRTKRLAKFQTAVEFQSTPGHFRYVSMRMLARTTGAPGAVTGMFTYRDDTGELKDIQESDIEILTRGPKDKIQYTNQPSYTDDGGTIPKATRNATTPDWSNWVVHRLDWTPKVVQWYVDGIETSSIKFQTPRDPLDMHFSAWSDGGSWSGKMPMNQEARQEVKWIQILYNATDVNVYRRGGKMQKRDDKQCKRVCSVDDAKKAGYVKVLSAAPRVMLAGGFTWAMALTLAAVVWVQL